MIVCQICGWCGEYESTTCPRCKKKIQLSREDIAARTEKIKKALSSRDYETAIENYVILADFGDAASQRELGILLESGDLINRDLDRAMKYFLLAAEQNDAVAAYRYARLASRTSDVAARFWLVYSAVLGCEAAYAEVAERFAAEGDHVHASYYYALAAESGDTDAIVTMAKRYHGGIGTEVSDQYARWYLDKLPIPPFHAIKLAYKLRATEAVEPPRVEFPDFDEFIRTLSRDAEKYKYSTAFLKLNEILAERGDTSALSVLGMLHAEGIGCEKNLVIAVNYLERAARQGNANAYYYLGDLFTTGKSFEVDINRALLNYSLAADHGIFTAYETMGDIFFEGKLVARDLARAIELYDKAAAAGVESAKKKSDNLKAKREMFFKYAKEAEYLDPAQCFRNSAISTAMGHVPAMKLLAHLYEVGNGTKKDRRRAFFWYNSALEAGDKLAAYEVGRCYAYGIGTAFNYKKAIENLQIAVAAGHAPAQRELDRLVANRNARISEKSFSTAMRLLYEKKFAPAKVHLDLCVSLGNPKAIYTLGCLHEFGVGVRVDKDYAFALYEDAYRLKFRDPRAVYKLRVLKMVR